MEVILEAVKTVHGKFYATFASILLARLKGAVRM